MSRNGEEQDNRSEEEQEEQQKNNNTTRSFLSHVFEQAERIEKSIF
jgi:hypothetical protein